MEAKSRARATIFFGILSWIWLIVAFSGMVSKQTPVDTNLTTRGKTAFAFASLAFIFITIGMLAGIYFLLRDNDGVKWRLVWVTATLACICSIVSFGTASQDSFEYGYGFAFVVLFFPFSALTAFFAFITDRSLGNI